MVPTPGAERISCAPTKDLGTTGDYRRGHQGRQEVLRPLIAPQAGALKCAVMGPGCGADIMFAYYAFHCSVFGWSALRAHRDHKPQLLS